MIRKCVDMHFILFCVLALVSCSTAYKAKPLPFKAPGHYPNATEIAGAEVAARAYAESAEAKETFGFNIREAGMLPVQVVFDNKGPHSLEIDASQTFLEDGNGNLWPILRKELAYERASKYAKTREIFKESAYHGFLGAAAGAIIGAAVGIIAGDSVGAAVGKGAAAGTAAGALLGGVKGYASNEAGRSIMEDLRNKSLQSKPVAPGSLAYGFIFFPGEAKSATQLRLKIIEKDTGSFHVILLSL
jgi:hypothetical protein